MRIAVVFGSNSEKIKNLLLQIDDSLEIETYTSVEEMINSATIRNFHYNRVILHSRVLDSSYATSIDNLFTYSRKVVTCTTFILFAHKVDDIELVQYFEDTMSPITSAALLALSLTSRELRDFINLSISDVIKTYGSLNEYKVQFVESSYDEPEPEQVPVPAIVQPTPKVKTKKGIFGNVFGKKKETSPVTPTPPILPITPLEESSTNIEDIDWEETYDEVTDSCIVDVQDKETEQDNIISKDVEQNYDSSILEAELTSISQAYQEDDDENSNLESIPQQLLQTENDTINFQQDFVAEDSYDDASELVEETDGLDLDIDDEFKVEEVDYNSVNNLLKEQAIDEVDEDDYVILNSSDFDTATSDISHLNLGTQETKESEHIEIQNIFEVDESESIIQVSALQDAYIQVTEKPREIIREVEKEVIREVIREVQVSKTGELDLLFSGKVRKILIFTGTRGSGITTTAFDVAKALSKKIKVLYFDTDIDNHGLLSHLDYSEFKTFGDSHLNGVSISKNKNLIKNAIIKMYPNLDILTSDYFTDIEDENVVLSARNILSMSQDYGAIIFDISLSKLNLYQEIMMTATNIVLCVEPSLRGGMNLLCSMDTYRIANNYRRLLANNGTLVYTGVPKDFLVDKIGKYIISNIVDFDITDVNFFDMRTLSRYHGSEITREFLDTILCN